jgi:nucleotide-binding universal stress UspA family protein
MNFTHVLVPTDLSPMAPHVVRCACEEAIRHDAKVTLLHVVASHAETVVYYVSALPSPALRFDPILGGPLGMPKAPPPTMILHDPQEDALQRLRDLIPVSCYSACEIVVATGNPVDLIVHVARARTVDLIVMGTHGYTGLRHSLWGKGFALRRRSRASVVAKVIRLAPCPVLVVRPQEESGQTATTAMRSHYPIAS